MLRSFGLRVVEQGNADSEILGFKGRYVLISESVLNARTEVVDLETGVLT